MRLLAIFVAFGCGKMSKIKHTSDAHLGLHCSFSWLFIRSCGRSCRRWMFLRTTRGTHSTCKFRAVVSEMVVGIDKFWLKSFELVGKFRVKEVLFKIIHLLYCSIFSFLSPAFVNCVFLITLQMQMFLDRGTYDVMILLSEYAKKWIHITVINRLKKEGYACDAVKGRMQSHVFIIHFLFVSCCFHSLLKNTSLPGSSLHILHMSEFIIHRSSSCLHQQQQHMLLISEGPTEGCETLHQ